MAPPADPASIVRVETTVEATHAREAGKLGRPVFLKADRELDSDAETWMFSDGSSSGWAGLVVLRPGEEAQLVARYGDATTRNVGAEMNAVVMAFDATLVGERVTVVSDFLWSIYYVLGWRNVHDEGLKEQVAKARALLAARRPASMRFIHIQGHVKDGSAFGQWNHVADELCSLGRAVDCTMPRSTFGAPSAKRARLAALLGTGAPPP